MATSGNLDGPEDPKDPAFEQKVQALLASIDGQTFDYIRFTFADLHGIARSKSVPRRHVKRFIEGGGVTSYSGTVGFGVRTELVAHDAVVQANFGNVFVRPVLSSVRSLPWATEGRFRVGELLCETFWSPFFLDGAPQSVCPRFASRRQLSRLLELGYRLKSGFEAEFAVFRTPDAATPLFSGRDVFSTLLLAEAEPLLYAFENGLASSGIDVLTVQTECGPGLMELTLAPGFDVAASDAMFQVREAVKEICSTRGLFATFMARPTETSGTTGLHFNHSLWSSDAERDEFYVDDAAAGRLSGVARRWLAGLVKHGRALTALCSPTVNCYRRLHSRSVPTSADWAFDDRRRAFRVVCCGPGATYIESRIPSGAANPYLVLAATVAAGIDGLQTLSPAGDDNAEAPVLPASLSEALDALEADSVIVNALGGELINWFVKIKREVEIERLKDVESYDAFAIERELYFKFL